MAVSFFLSDVKVPRAYHGLEYGYGEKVQLGS